MALQLSRESDRLTLKDADLVPDGDPDVTYTVRPLTPQTSQRIRNQAGRNPDAIVRAMLDHALEAWEGVLIDGQPAPCDTAHKMLLPLNVAAAIVDRASSGVRAKEEAAQQSFR